MPNHGGLFKEPDPKEEKEHFLERIRRELPDPGQVCFFDRSHYEDAIAPRAAGELGDDDLATRVKEIREFEQGLVDNGTWSSSACCTSRTTSSASGSCAACSYPTSSGSSASQISRRGPTWPSVEAAYCEVIGATSYDFAPWYVVPADHKWYRNFAVATLLAQHLVALGERYPGLGADADPDDLTARLNLRTEETSTMTTEAVTPTDAEPAHIDSTTPAAAERPWHKVPPLHKRQVASSPAPTSC